MMLFFITAIMVFLGADIDSQLPTLLPARRRGDNVTIVIADSCLLALGRAWLRRAGWLKEVLIDTRRVPLVVSAHLYCVV